MRIKGWTGLLALVLGAHVTAAGHASAQVAPLIEKVSLGDRGQQVSFNSINFANPLSALVRVSFDGDRVLFESFNPLTVGDQNRTDDGFVRTRSSQTTERVTLRADGTEFTARGYSLSPEIADMSSNGRFVVFSASEGVPVGADTRANRELFVRDLVTGETEVVSLTPEGLSATDAGFFRGAAVSDDGNIVAFVSNAKDQVRFDGNGVGTDVFLRDRSQGKTIRLRVPDSPFNFFTSVL